MAPMTMPAMAPPLSEEPESETEGGVKAVEEETNGVEVGLMVENGAGVEVDGGRAGDVGGCCGLVAESAEVGDGADVSVGVEVGDGTELLADSGELSEDDGVEAKEDSALKAEELPRSAEVGLVEGVVADKETTEG